MSTAQPWVEEEPLTGTEDGEHSPVVYYYDNKMHFEFKEKLKLSRLQKAKPS